MLSNLCLGVLNERIQHHHILTLLDSLADGLLDSQVHNVSGVDPSLAKITGSRALYLERRDIF